MLALTASALGLAAPEVLALPLDVLQLIAVAVGAVAVLARVGASTDAAPRPMVAATALGIGIATAAALVGAIRPSSDIARAAVPLLGAASGVCIGVPLAIAFLAGLTSEKRGQAALDGLTVTLAAACLLTPAWFAVGSGPGVLPATQALAALATVVVAGPMAGALVLVDRRLPPGLWGPWATVTALFVTGGAILAHLTAATLGGAPGLGLSGFAISTANLLVAWGALSWHRVPAPRRWWGRTAQFLVDTFPAVATALAVAAALLSAGQPYEGAIHLLAAAVLGIALVRQVHLVRRERRTAAAQLSAAQRLTREIRRRAEMAAWLASFEACPTAEETATRICEGMASVGGVDEAVVVAFEADGTSRIIGEAGPVTLVEAVGDLQPEALTRYFRGRAAEGPWEEALRDRSDPHALLLQAGGLEWVTNAPISHGGVLLGRLSISAGDGMDMQRERLVTAGELGAIAGAVLGPAMAERARLQAARREIEEVIDGWAFRTVFQPIVDLQSRAVVGHEALTRFEDGFRPDLRFEAAESVGLGRALEIATLESAAVASGRVPRETYLSLNVSPELALDLDAVRGLVDRVACPVVLEITEHAAVESYELLRASLGRLRGLVRIAVDDVGAGYSGLRHILEISPDLLKLDIALVRGVDGDAAKRALIRGILSFAGEAGCRVVAEGIERPEEEAILAELGVALGQGYLFGRPAGLDQVAVDGWLGMRPTGRAPQG